jgi:formate hydrogenlyase subunit 3/multisubunit Na+/H+ antiporter MnhD subunit
MGYTILFISVITALYGIIYAVNQKDIKKLLAYSSVENIGIIGIAISTIIFGQIYVNNLVIMLGVAGCFLHILNHSIFKSLLFMGVGSVYLKTHTKNIELLGGLIKKMPFTALFFLFGSIAICAFPPLNGFISEFLIYIGLLNMLKLNSSTLFIPVILTIGVLALVGTLVILAMSKLYSIIFLGKARSEHIDKVDYDVPQTMLIPMGILSGLTIVIGISSAFIVNIIPFSAFEIPVLVRYEYLYIFLQLTIISLIVLVFCLFIVISLYLRFMFLKKSQTYQTWSCGYNKGNNHIQYTASSFVSPFTSILTPLFKKIFDVKKPKGLFPKDAHYTSTVEDVEEAYIINPLLKFDEKLLTKFERLQDGNIQHYILYGLIFLILILIGVVIIG